MIFLCFTVVEWTGDIFFFGVKDVVGYIKVIVYSSCGISYSRLSGHVMLQFREAAYAGLIDNRGLFLHFWGHTKVVPEQLFGMIGHEVWIVREW